MLARDLKGRAVVALSDAAKVGAIDDILFDPQFRQVLGFRVKKGTFGQPEALPRDAVSAVGRDAVTIPAPDAINAESRFVTLAHAATEGQAHGTRVVSEGGDVLGTIEDLELDDQAQTVTGYILSGSIMDRLRHRQTEIASDQVLRLGAGGIMIVPNSVAEHLHDQQA